MDNHLNLSKESGYICHTLPSMGSFIKGKVYGNEDVFAVIDGKGVKDEDGRWVSFGELEFLLYFCELTESTEHLVINSKELTIHKGSSSTTGFWFLNASPKQWNLSNLSVGSTRYYTIYNEKGNKRRIFRNFLEAQVGDIVIGYESYPVKQISAVLRVSQAQDGERIYFQKISHLDFPVGSQLIKERHELVNMEFNINPQGSLFKLTEVEYDVIRGMILQAGNSDWIQRSDLGTVPDLKISDFAKAVGDNALRHGFRDVLTKPSDYLVLIHSEVSEVIEEFRNGHEATEVYYRESDGKPEGVPMELADVVIRCFDMADAYGIDLESAIIEKHKFNLSRPYRNGKRF